jgi:hypothetical protein
MVPHINMLGPSMRFLTLRKGLGTLVVFENNNRIFAIKMNIEILHLPVNGRDLSCHIKFLAVGVSSDTMAMCSCVCDLRARHGGATKTEAEPMPT